MAAFGLTRANRGGITGIVELQELYHHLNIDGARPAALAESKAYLAPAFASRAPSC